MSISELISYVLEKSKEAMKDLSIKAMPSVKIFGSTAMPVMQNLGSEAKEYLGTKAMPSVKSFGSTAMPVMQNLGYEAKEYLGTRAMPFMQNLGSEARVYVGTKAMPFMQNLWSQARALFDKAFSADSREWMQGWVRDHKWLLISAVILIVVISLSRGRGGGGVVKMMKAPGRNHTMPRSVFESDAKGYFRNLRSR